MGGWHQLAPIRHVTKRRTTAMRVGMLARASNLRLPARAKAPARAPGIRRHLARPLALGSDAPGPSDEAEDDDNPHLVLRVSPGTSYQGLLIARKEALFHCQGDVKQEQRVERAFVRFVEGARVRLQKEAEGGGATETLALANFHHTVGEVEEAEEMYRKVLELDPSLVDGWNQLGMLLQEERGDPDGAEAMYERACELEPSNVDVLFNWAQLKLYARQDLQGTRGIVEKIIVLRPDLAAHPLVKALREEDPDT